MRLCEQVLHAKALEVPNTLRILKLVESNETIADEIVQFIKRYEINLVLKFTFHNFKPFIKILLSRIQDFVDLPDWKSFILEKPKLFCNIFVKYSCEVRRRQYLDQYGSEDFIPEGELPSPTEKLSSDISELFQRQVFTDVTFKLADGELKGHKGILSCNITSH
jgi:hypothetical protein